jgi:capsular exopolysaccharide synthesis family protein
MSRVDEALRRAALDSANLYPPVGLEQGAAAVDETALHRYGVEKPVAHIVDAAATRPAPARVPNAVPNTLPRRLAARRDVPRALDPSLEGKLVIGRETSSVSIEQYRRLAATLHAAQAERGLKTLMVSSAVPNEGKTLTVANLALTLSESFGLRVLLMDADLRRPSVHELFGLANMTGLGDVLRSNDAQLNPTQITANLSVLPAGPADRSPMAALSSERMRAVVADASAHFDWVLLDSPPIGLLSDAQLVARVCDGVLFVIAAGATPYHLVQRSIAELGPERIIGTVLNRVEQQTLTGHYYGGYYSRHEP